MGWTKLQTAQFLGWSEKTLERKAKDGSDLAKKLGKRGGKGTGSHVSFSEELVRIFKAKLDGENVEEMREVLDAEIEPEMSDNSDTAKNNKLVKSQSAVNTGLSTIEKSDTGIFSEIEAALILPQKKLLTINEARKLTGCPLFHVEKYKHKIRGKNYIDARDLDTIVDEFLDLKYDANKPEPKKKKK